jgi:hypothetical protein
MMDLARVADAVYSAFLCFYPAKFRAEFGGEMQAVFMESLLHARRRGFLAVVSLCFREIGDFPVNIIGEYWEVNLMKNLQLSQPIIRPVWWGAVGFGFTAVLAKILSDVVTARLYSFLDTITPYWFPFGELALYAFAGWLGGILFGLASQQFHKVRLFGLAGFAGFLIGHIFGIFGSISLSVFFFFSSADASWYAVVRVLDLLCIGVLTGLLIGLLNKDRKQAGRLALSSLMGTIAGGLIAVVVFLILTQFAQSVSDKILVQTGMLFVVNAMAGIFGGAMLGREIGRRHPSPAG